jgi:hypothetical protein
MGKSLLRTSNGSVAAPTSGVNAATSDDPLDQAMSNLNIQQPATPPASAPAAYVLFVFLLVLKCV